MTPTTTHTQPTTNTERLAEALKTVLASAVPSGRDNPRMAEAWVIGHKALAAHTSAPSPAGGEPAPASNNTGEDYFCQWCYDRGLRYPDDGHPWRHGLNCPKAPPKEPTEVDALRSRVAELEAWQAADKLVIGDLSAELEAVIGALGGVGAAEMVGKPALQVKWLIEALESHRRTIAGLEIERERAQDKVHAGMCGRALRSVLAESQSTPAASPWIAVSPEGMPVLSKPTTEGWWWWRAKGGPERLAAGYDLEDWLAVRVWDAPSLNCVYNAQPREKHLWDMLHPGHEWHDGWWGEWVGPIPAPSPTQQKGGGL